MKSLSFAGLIISTGFILLWGLFYFDAPSDYRYARAMEYIPGASIGFLVSFWFYSKYNWSDDFIYILLRRIGFSIGILRQRAKENINKAIDKMRDDMGEWH